MGETETIERARHWPKMPPRLPGEDGGAYTDRLTGADGTNRIPYDHRRNRQCSIGWHGECSERGPEHDADRGCECPCHTPVGRLEMRVDELEELFICAWALVTGTRSGERGAGIRESIRPEAEALVKQRPQLAEWYLSEG